MTNKPMTRLGNVNLNTLRQRDLARARTFRPLAIEIGWLVFEWNRLQEALAELFADLVSEQKTALGFAVWHSTPSDRAQRHMLRAVLGKLDVLDAKQGRAQKDITWMLNQLDALAGRRNDALHAPLVFANQTGADGQIEAIEILPLYFFGNPRATQLKDKSLPEEFRWYRDHLSKLAHFAERLHYAIYFFSEYPWPDRPRLLPREHFRTRAPQHRKRRSR